MKKNKNKIDFEHRFYLHKSYHNPWFMEMAITLWNQNKPLIYPNENNELISRNFDGTINPVKKKQETNKEIFDKRYMKPFEDDGAYAD